MKANSHPPKYPDLSSNPTALTFGKNWDTLAVARLIHGNSPSGTSPAFLFLGRKEASLLHDHLAQAFGEESVTTLHDTYYMGLKIIMVDAEQYIRTGGSKPALTLQSPRLRHAS